ncbi:MAG: hypothetical protein M1837_007307 [Sclerophora amabilis]|nr:MAG: hypothetical protein M1837_007307 [Sclerophora amabilis]
MESASLIRAHTHARSALSKSLPSNVTSAIEEHSSAAGEFAQAAKGIGDAEALRTLKLLEQHHQKLSQILKFRSSHPVPPPVLEDTDHTSSELKNSTGSGHVSKQHTVQAAQGRRSSSPNRSSHPAPPLPLPSRTPPRDLTSSIASNLATARGIPSSQQRRGAPVSPTLSMHHAGGKILNSPEKAKSIESRQSRVQAIPEENLESPQKGHGRGPLERSGSAEIQSPVPSSKEHPGADKLESATSRGDEPFQRFYSTFEGLLSKLSAPLAFAGLPLTTDQDVPSVGSEMVMTSQREGQEPANAEPDLTKLFSKASLRAIRDVNGQNTSFGAGGESFYVVPSTGGTISYAGILSRAEQERRAADLGLQGNIGDSDVEEDPEFVDAKETLQSPSSGLRRKSTPRTQRASIQTKGFSAGSNKKTMEELQLENQALKQLSDTLSRRLHMWEVNAQSSSIALQQSLRAMSQQSPSGSDAGRPIGDDVAEKIRELEHQLKMAGRETEKMTRENEKLKVVVGRYREKWEKLKEGARMRRENGIGDGKGPGDPSREE